MTAVWLARTHTAALSPPQKKKARAEARAFPDQTIG
jgi:hypothetical protein